MPGDAASIEIAKIDANARLGVADIGAGAQTSAAQTGAAAQRYGADTGASNIANELASRERTSQLEQENANARNEASIAGENARNAATNATSTQNTIIGNSLYPESAGGYSPAGIGQGVRLSPNSPNMPSSGNMPGVRQQYAGGTAKVPGHGDGTVDTVDAKLAPGEAVLNKAAAEMLGRGLIDLLNKHGMLKMGMADPREEADEPEGYACGTSNVKGYATGTAYVEPLAVQRAPVPAAPMLTMGMPAGNPAIGGGGWADPGAMERARTSAPPAPMMVPQQAVQPISPIPTIDRGPAPSAPDQSATAWGNRAPPPSMLASRPDAPILPDPGAMENARNNPRPVGPPEMTRAPAPQSQSAAPPAITNDMSFDQAFKAARDAFGGAGGQFDWHGKSYQTNVKGENYAKTPKPAF